MARLVQNMLDITKLESGEVKGTPKNYDIWSTVTDVVLSDERRIEDGKIDIQGLGPTGTMVYADPDFIHQVVYNIVDNAIKFTPPDGVIKFDIQQENDMVRVTIENTGDGIAPDALPFVFERFYKGGPLPRPEHPRQRPGVAYLQGADHPVRRPDQGRKRDGQMVPLHLYPACRQNRVTAPTPESDTRRQ